MRGMIKGGIWRNTEDEILKAAIMKYGKNQWARISSLLVRKTPKQCKARWYEWLDPSIKKTEWSREEEEKLLHLAKLMPCQWRTIAPIIGRTPAQCLEHYEKLLDQAQGRDETIDKDDPRKLKPGEVDPTPETKAPKPDPVDMDEDEKEMLAEARARLANTQGKKAKRKAREKQLEEARRLASLQKRRELKAAGIELHDRRRKQKGVDYMLEIPFEKKPAAGFYDTSDERVKDKGKDFTNITLQEMEGKRRRDIEDEERKRDAKRQKQLKEAGQVSAQGINKFKTPEAVKRSKLELPSPQISEGDLEEIVKMGYAGESMRAAVEDDANEASRALLSNYNLATPNAAQLRTPNPAQLHPLDNAHFNTPSHAPMRTPVPSQMRVSQTPLRSASGGVESTPLRTPLRDELSINRNEVLGETPRLERMRQASMKEELKRGLMSLPKPKNEFELVLPEEEKDEEGEQSEQPLQDGWEEDAADIQARRARILQEEESKRLRLRSQAIQRSLPRPVAVNKALANKENALNAADELVHQEMVAMLHNDAVHHPVRGAKPKYATEEFEAFSEEELKEAAALLTRELAELEKPNEEEVASILERVSGDFIFLPSVGHYGQASQTPVAEQIASLQNQLEVNRGQISKEVKKAAKMEQKLAVVLGGYQNRSQVLRKQVQTLAKDITQALLEKESFRLLHDQELVAIPKRIEDLQQEVDLYFRKENELQRKYANLVMEREELLKGQQ